MKPKINAAQLQEYIQSVPTIKSFAPDAHHEAFPFITISRETCAGGRLLAETLLEKMSDSPFPLLQGWTLLDRNLCRKIIEDLHLKVAMDSFLTEKFLNEMEDYLSQILIGQSPQMTVFHKVSQVIRAFAVQGKVIILGRAGSLLTRDLPLGIHVRLVAPQELRIRTMVRESGLSKEAARQEIEEQDQSRRLLVKSYFNNKMIDDPLLYDSVWNTASVPIPTIASFLIRWVNEKMLTPAAGLLSARPTSSMSRN